MWKRFEMVEGKEKGSIMLEPTQDQLNMNGACFDYTTLLGL